MKGPGLTLKKAALFAGWLLKHDLQNQTANGYLFVAAMAVIFFFTYSFRLQGMKTPGVLFFYSPCLIVNSL